MMGVDDITMIESRCAESQHEMEFGLPMVDVKLQLPERDLGPDALSQSSLTNSALLPLLARRI